MGGFVNKLAKRRWILALYLQSVFFVLGYLSFPFERVTDGFVSTLDHVISVALVFLAMFLVPFVGAFLLVPLFQGKTNKILYPIFYIMGTSGLNFIFVRYLEFPAEWIERCHDLGMGKYFAIAIGLFVTGMIIQNKKRELSYIFIVLGLFLLSFFIFFIRSVPF
jgi:hypothetical protein